ncbi:beta-ketoacyl synthase chain length factor [Endozoicomonas atrinae]|uniref:beta-ketoacyl synthase chain length factor n=1 Tax=Endozoicomonas atrinae TaxID=1333660 RepID=UPI000825E415|nr:beta-ketoacyl synthase chain length factor [Endozoicomonas atrinae]
MTGNWQAIDSHFDIVRWDACSGSVRTMSQWLDSDKGPGNTEPDKAFSDSPEYLYLTPRQRRRLSTVSKLALDVAVGCMDGQHQAPAVFASRYGEVGRMAGLLEDICSGEDASPTDFSLSVHNTSSGLLSIQTGNQKPSTAISAGHDSLGAGLIEAVSQLGAGLPEVLLVVFEDQMPDVYRCFGSRDEYPIAAAFLLKSGGSYRLSVRGGQMIDSQVRAPFSTFSQLRQLIGGVSGKRSTVITGERMSCRIEKA